MCESMFGIYPIISEIDKRKLFFGKLCNLDSDSFLSRLYDFINNDERPFSGFLHDILIKYNLLQHLRTFTANSQFPVRNEWKSVVKQAIRHNQTGMENPHTS